MLQGSVHSGFKFQVQRDSGLRDWGLSPPRSPELNTPYAASRMTFCRFRNEPWAMPEFSTSQRAPDVFEGWGLGFRASGFEVFSTLGECSSHPEVYSCYPGWVCLCASVSWPLLWDPKDRQRVCSRYMGGCQN